MDSHSSMAQSGIGERGHVTAAERHRRSMELFDRARELDGEERRRYLDSACGADDESRRYVESLLAHDSAPIPLIAELDRGGAGRLAHSSAAPATAAGERVGVYVLSEKLGEGGFGEVFRAEQTQPFRREVAIKLIKPGMDSRQVVSRFDAERQALAYMDHPGVARVFDGGVSAAGRPYFVMELARGEPITAYCDRQQLSVRERLELFVDICDAVQHAHTKGVVHRDLKPANILVAHDADRRPAPKVIDFGVAKALHQPLTEQSLQTGSGQLLGTPEFMSPEQADLDGGDVDTRSDVYALGVVLYELLTGMRPFERDVVRRAGLLELIRLIREAEPPRPSVRVRDASRGASHDASVHQAARARRSSVPALIRHLKGDLDWIIIKCLEKDRTRRYQTVAALAQDIQHFLRCEPVIAGPPGVGYRVQKFVRRNRGVVAAGALLTVALVSATAISIRFGLGEAAARAGERIALEHEREQRALAEQRASETQQVAELQGRIYRDIDAEAMGRGIKKQLREQVRAALERELVGDATEQRKRTAEEVESAMNRFDELAAAALPADVARNVMDQFVLAPASQTLLRELEQQPQARSRLEAAIGGIYHSLGVFAIAEEHLREAVRLRDDAGGEHDASYADALNELGEVLKARGQYAEAETTLQRALELRRSIHGDASEAVAYTRNDLAMLYLAQGDLKAAEPLFLQARERYEALLGARHPHIAAVNSNLAAICSETGRLAEAEANLREAADINRAALGEDAPELAAVLHNLGTLLLRKRDFSEAEHQLREALRIRRKALGDEHPQVGQTLMSLSTLFAERHNATTAEPLLREALAVNRKLLGPEHPDVLTCMNNVAQVAFDRGDWDAAEPQLRAVLALRRKVLGERHPDVAVSLGNLAATLQARGDLHAAEELYRDALEIQRSTLGDQSPELAGSIDRLATVYWKQGDLERAEPLFREALALRRKLLGADHPDYAGSLNNLGLMLKDKHAFAEAESLLREALALYRHKLGDEHMSVSVGMNNLGLVLTEKRQFDEAEALFRDALAMRRRLVGDLHPAVTACLSNLATLQTAKGDFVAAEAPLREIYALYRRRPNTPRSLLAANAGKLGANLVQQGRDSDALPFLREVTVIDEQTGVPGATGLAAQLSLARCLLRLNMTDDAERELLALVERGGNDKSTRSIRDAANAALAEIYDSQGRTDDATRRREQARDLPSD